MQHSPSVQASGSIRDRALDSGTSGSLGQPTRPDPVLGGLDRMLSGRVRLRFWGVRGTLPVPGSKSLRYGGNTSCVSLDFPEDRLFVFDAGSGIRELSDHLSARDGGSVEGKIFITHPHWDHINSIPFFAPLYRPGNAFEILGAAHGKLTMRELVSAQMDGVYFPITIKEFGARVGFRNLKEGTFEVDGIQVKTMRLAHPGFRLGYRIDHDGRSICYVTDNELPPPSSELYSKEYVLRLADFVRDADALITDTTYTDSEYEAKQGWGHSCVSQVIDLVDRADVKTLYIYHHDPSQTDDDIDQKLESCLQKLKERGSSAECRAPRERDEFSI